MDPAKYKKEFQKNYLEKLITSRAHSMSDYNIRKSSSDITQA